MDGDRRRWKRRQLMLALIALILFVLSPFVPTLGPWPVVTLRLVFLAAHLLIGACWPWRR